MENRISNNDMNNIEEQEIDLLELVTRLWSKRMFIIKITAVFMVLGVFVAIFSPKEYSASCTIVPQTKSKSAGGSLSALASMAGISLGDIGGGETLSPLVYSNVMNNKNLLKELIYTPISFSEFDEPVTLLDYYTNPDYQKFSLMGTVKKYTIGLPGLILGAIIKKEEQPSQSPGGNSNLVTLTKQELACIKAIKAQTNILIEKKDGYISISSNMPEALAAAQVTERMVDLLQKYVTEFKIQKASAEYEFISQRYDEAWNEYSKKHEEYAKFKDANRSFSTAVAATREEHIRNEYNVAYSLFSELSKQKVQAEIRVKEDTPIFTIIEPVTVPLEKSKPKRSMILIAFTFLGGALACGLVFGFDFLKKNFDIKYLNKWE